MITMKQHEEKTEVQHQEELILGLSTQQLSLEMLQALQLEMKPVNMQAKKAFYRLKLKTVQRVLPHLEYRSTIIQGIPGFWTKVFVNHPQMSTMINQQDQDMLSFMFNLQVEELREANCCKITLFFRKNNYFHNDVIVKEYLTNLSGLKPSHSTPIQWCHDYKGRAYRRWHNNCTLNLFNWFYNHNFKGSTTIAEIIYKELWPNPLKYYLQKKVPEQGTVRLAGRSQFVMSGLDYLCMPMTPNYECCLDVFFTVLFLKALGSGLKWAQKNRPCKGSSNGQSAEELCLAIKTGYLQ
ncbi:testis-specific Y-encoded protein 2-like [Suncus etruscus]|uniref:testis-specific Y-encoded protein 2-like n=1 Tax=Suncus etruscus TaxID=109475 RepID=UPI00210FE667|nr:testis-specific Y-encoded protein 2-like [Suncus etruscus]